MDRGAWRATVHRVTKSQMQLKWQHTLVYRCLLYSSSSFSVCLKTFKITSWRGTFFGLKKKKKKTLLNYSLQWNGLLAGGHYYLANVFKAKALWQNKQASFLHRERNPSTSLCIPYILKNYWALKSIWLSIRGEKALVISFPGLFSNFILVYQY